MSTEKPMKPETRKVPGWIKCGFIALQIAVLALRAIAIYFKSQPHIQDALSVADCWLAFILLASTVEIYFFAPRLARSGILVIVFWVLTFRFGP